MRGGSHNQRPQFTRPGLAVILISATLLTGGCGNDTATQQKAAAPDPAVPTSTHVTPPTGPTIAELRKALGVNNDAVFQKRGGQIVMADLSNQPIDDLSPLEGLPLTVLDITGVNISDLSPLSAMPLDTLLLAKTSVTDLTPLADSPLERFSFAETDIADLAPPRWPAARHARRPRLAGRRPLAARRHAPPRTRAPRHTRQRHRAS